LLAYLEGTEVTFLVRLALCLTVRVSARNASASPRGASEAEFFLVTTNVVATNRATFGRLAVVRNVPGVGRWLFVTSIVCHPYG
jgi:hypothetical protein